MSTPFHSSTSAMPDAPTGTSNVAIVHRRLQWYRSEVTKRLAAKGYRVVANSRNITSAMTLQATGDLKLVDGDIGLPGDGAGECLRSLCGILDASICLVNNAGGLHTQAVY